MPCVNVLKSWRDSREPPPSRDVTHTCTRPVPLDHWPLCATVVVWHTSSLDHIPSSLCASFLGDRIPLVNVVHLVRRASGFGPFSPHSPLLQFGPRSSSSHCPPAFPWPSSLGSLLLLLRVACALTCTYRRYPSSPREFAVCSRVGLGFPLVFPASAVLWSGGSIPATCPRLRHSWFSGSLTSWIRSIAFSPHACVAACAGVFSAGPCAWSRSLAAFPHLKRSPRASQDPVITAG